MQDQNYEIFIPSPICDYAPMSNRDDAYIYADVGERVALVRRMLGWNQTRLAKEFDWQPSRLSNWEVGISLIPPREVRRLKQLVPGLTQDWIYDGDTNGLTVDLLSRLNAAPADEDDGSTKRGRPRKTRG